MFEGPKSRKANVMFVFRSPSNLGERLLWARTPLCDDFPGRLSFDQSVRSAFALWRFLKMYVIGPMRFTFLGGFCLCLSFVAVFFVSFVGFGSCF